MTLVDKLSSPLDCERKEETEYRVHDKNKLQFIPLVVQVIEF